MIRHLNDLAVNIAIKRLSTIGVTPRTDKVIYDYVLDKIIIYLETNSGLNPKLFRKGMKYIEFNTLVPLAHPTINKLYRVPIKITKTQYKVYVDKGSVRIFTQDTVPPHLLSKLTMAKAACDTPVKDSELYEYDLFVSKDKNGMADVAWRASESMYTVILDDTELSELQGKHL